MEHMSNIQIVLENPKLEIKNLGCDSYMISCVCFARFARVVCFHALIYHVQMYSVRGVCWCSTAYHRMHTYLYVYVLIKDLECDALAPCSLYWRRGVREGRRDEQ